MPYISEHLGAGGRVANHLSSALTSKAPVAYASLDDAKGTGQAIINLLGDEVREKLPRPTKAEFTCSYAPL